MKRVILLIVLCLSVFPALAQTITVTDGLIMHPLPKFVQELSNEDYVVWANWQNAQAEKWAADPATVNYEQPYISGIRTVISASGSVNTAARSGTSSTSRSSTFGASKGGRFTIGGNTANSRTANSSGFKRSNGLTTIEQIPTRYRNSEYMPPPSIIYNPYAKATGGVGQPDWNSLYVPCKKIKPLDPEVMTVQEALNKHGGPIDPEKLFTELMQPFFQK